MINIYTDLRQRFTKVNRPLFALSDLDTCEEILIKTLLRNHFDSSIESLKSQRPKTEVETLSTHMEFVEQFSIWPELYSHIASNLTLALPPKVVRILNNKLVLE